MVDQKLEGTRLLDLPYSKTSEAVKIILTSHFFFLGGGERDGTPEKFWVAIPGSPPVPGWPGV